MIVSQSAIIMHSPPLQGRERFADVMHHPAHVSQHVIAPGGAAGHGGVRGSSYGAGRHQSSTEHLGAGRDFARATIRADSAGRVGFLKDCCAMMQGGAAGNEGF